MVTVGNYYKIYHSFYLFAYFLAVNIFFIYKLFYANYNLLIKYIFLNKILNKC